MASTLSALLVVAHSNGDKYALKLHSMLMFLMLEFEILQIT